MLMTSRLDIGRCKCHRYTETNTELSRE